MMKKINSFTVIENGELKEYIVVKLCTYRNNNYIIYHTPGEDDCHASRYYLANDNIVLDEIRTDDEWNYLEKVLGDNNE